MDWSGRLSDVGTSAAVDPNKQPIASSSLFGGHSRCLQDASDSLARKSPVVADVSTQIGENTMSYVRIKQLPKLRMIAMLSDRHRWLSWHYPLTFSLIHVRALPNETVVPKTENTERSHGYLCPRTNRYTCEFSKIQGIYRPKYIPEECRSRHRRSHLADAQNLCRPLQRSYARLAIQFCNRDLIVTNGTDYVLT